MEIKLIIVVAVILGIVAIAQLTRIYELSSILRKKREEEISYVDNSINAIMMIVFMILLFGSMIYLMANYGRGGMPEAASAHGRGDDMFIGQDDLLMLNFAIVVFVFFLTNFLLFYFAFKYRAKPGNKALYFSHSNKLEMVWTVIPALVLAVIIILGLKQWNEVTGPPSDEAYRVEIYSKQFDWTVRYSGKDNKLGKTDYRLVTADNPLGIVTKATIDSALVGMDQTIVKLTADLNDATKVFSKDKEESMELKRERLERIRKIVFNMQQTHNDSLDAYSQTDFPMAANDTLYLLKDKEYEFQFRSQDVIHSAYFPHFRAQMNTVPGMKTRFKFTPVYTTEEMRVKVKDEKFNYILMCNKICGSAHSNMKLDVVVLDTEEYLSFLYRRGTDTGTFDENGDKVSDELDGVKDAFPTDWWSLIKELQADNPDYEDQLELDKKAATSAPAPASEVVVEEADVVVEEAPVAVAQ